MRTICIGMYIICDVYTNYRIFSYKLCTYFVNQMAQRYWSVIFTRLHFGSSFSHLIYLHVHPLHKHSMPEKWYYPKTQNSSDDTNSKNMEFIRGYKFQNQPKKV